VLLSYWPNVLKGILGALCVYKFNNFSEKEEQKFASLAKCCNFVENTCTEPEVSFESIRRVASGAVLIAN
jgi:hypothetical protein